MTSYDSEEVSVILRSAPENMMLENKESVLQEAGHIVLKALRQYLQESRAGFTPVLQMRPIDEISKELKLDEYIRNGGLDLPSFQVWLDKYLMYSMHMHHPGYIGHQVAVPHLASALSDLIHGVIGNPMSIYEMGPSAATVERSVTNWMLEKVGWQHSGGGVLTNGGSIANLHAMLAARAEIAPDAWTEGNPDDLVVLCPDNAHYCIHRAVSMIGLGSNAVKGIPTDRNEVIIPDQLEKLIEDCRSNQKRIMAVVANACATSTGLYDPIESIAKICKREKVWLHLDSPHGATALLSVKYRHYLHGIKAADSMVWDAHKMMQTSPLCTGILFRQQRYLVNAFAQKASYLIYEKENPGRDTLPYQIECTKSALATKVFLVLASMGERGLGNYVAKLYDLSKSFALLINQQPGFSSPFPVHSNIVCFQYKANEIDQLMIRQRIIDQGRFYISSTEVKGERYLRLTVMNTSTDQKGILQLLKEIESIAESN